MKFHITKKRYRVALNEAEWRILEDKEEKDAKSGAGFQGLVWAMLIRLEEAGCSEIVWNKKDGKEIYFTCYTENSEKAKTAIKKEFGIAQIHDEAIVNKLVDILKNDVIDIASLENAKLRRKNETHADVPLFEMATCPTFTANPENPKWLKLVREYVEFHYDSLTKRFKNEIKKGK